MAERQHHVFYDPQGKRWRSVSRTGIIVSTAASIILVAFIATLLLYPSLSSMERYQMVLQAFAIHPETREEATAHFLAWRTMRKAIEEEPQPTHEHQHAISTIQPYNITTGFYVNWDANSFSSVQRHINQLTFLMPCWLSLSQDDTLFDSNYSLASHDHDVEILAQKYHVPIIPVLANLSQSDFDWSLLYQLLSSPARQQQLAGKLHRYLKQHAYAGINLDFELPVDTMSSHERRQARRLMHTALPQFIEVLRQEFGADKLLITQDVPPWDNYFDYDQLGDLNDFLIIMQYDQHTIDGEPGPIASQQWLEETANKLFAHVDASKIILGIGNYAYDWPINLDANGKIVSYDSGKSIPLSSALSLAKVAGVSLHMDDDDLNPYFFYTDNNDHVHIVYLLDAVTAYNHIRAMQGYQPRGAALWYLGSEDPTLWTFFNEKKLARTINMNLLQQVDFQRVTDTDGDPTADELVQIAATNTSGRRMLQFDSDGLIINERFQPYPAPNTIYQFPIQGKIVALTFDDGPDPVYTPQILDILKQKHVPATFFVVGEHAITYPEIVRSCWLNHNEIGNHSFTHPHIAQITPWRLQGELTSTDRVIESITGRGNLLFRPPYGEGPDSNLSVAQDIPVLAELQRKGYLIVGMNIDPQDYLQPSPKIIVNTIMKSLVGNHIILLHDSGGKRDNTVKALPLIIDAVQKQGYRFVTISEMLSPQWREKVFPPLPVKERVIAGFDRVIFELWYYGGTLLRYAILFSMLFGVLRLVIMVPLIWHHHRRIALLQYHVNTQPSVTVAIPAYNEQAVIIRTVYSVLQSDYPDLQIIVVDDGSTDDTYAVLQATFPDHPRVRIYTQANGGKSTALNYAFEKAVSEIVVCIDADTLVLPDTITLLVRQFADNRVGAVAGNVKVGNRINTLTNFQSLEYITNQNFERQSFAALDAVAIIPGAISGWRRSAVNEAGGFQDDTLAEDMDLTFRVRKRGYLTRCDNMALAYTEVPATLSALIRQRFRWSYGVLQTLWKHRDILAQRRYGAFSLLAVPSMWVSQLLLQALVPFVDIGIIFTLINGEYYLVVFYLAVFMLIDGLTTIIALRLDREPITPIAWLLLQRAFYREFSWYLLSRSLFTAIHGSLVGWGKLSREASVVIPET